MHMAISNNSVVNCKLFSAQRQDCRSFEELCQQWPWDQINYVVADKGYAPHQMLRVLLRATMLNPLYLLREFIYKRGQV